MRVVVGLPLCHRSNEACVAGGVMAAYAWVPIGIVMAHHEGTEAGSGGVPTTLLAIIGGIISVGVITSILFRIWDTRRNAAKKLRRGL